MCGRTWPGRGKWGGLWILTCRTETTTTEMIPAAACGETHRWMIRAASSADGDVSQDEDGSYLLRESSSGGSTGISWLKASGGSAVRPVAACRYTLSHCAVSWLYTKPTVCSLGWLGGVAMGKATVAAPPTGGGGSCSLDSGASLLSWV